MTEEPPSTGPSTHDEIAVILRDARWHEVLDAEALARRAAAAALARPEVRSRRAGAEAEGWELALVLADDGLVRELNRRYRGRDAPTNVLSFADVDAEGPRAAGMPRLLGDVVLARETVLREAADQGKRPGDHLAHLVVHGILHLLGWDHESESEAERMEALERSILDDMGIADPYLAAEGGLVAHAQGRSGS